MQIRFLVNLLYGIYTVAFVVYLIVLARAFYFGLPIPGLDVVHFIIVPRSILSILRRILDEDTRRIFTMIFLSGFRLLRRNWKTPTTAMFGRALARLSPILFLCLILSTLYRFMILGFKSNAF